MPEWLLAVLTSVGTLVLTLTVTRIYNKVVSLPKDVKTQKANEKAREAQVEQENSIRDAKIAALEAAIASLPAYRAKSADLRAELQNADKEILAACNEIKDSMAITRTTFNERIDRLEQREKNAIRAKILDEYRFLADVTKNPMLAWSEMEHHAFFELVKDYEDLHGNDYVHKTVIPAMNGLVVVSMSDKKTLIELMNSRRL